MDAVGSSRGPVRDDTVRRTLCRRNTGRSANVALVSGDVDRRRSGVEDRRALGDVEGVADVGEVGPAEVARVASVRLDDARVAGDRVAVVRATSFGVAVDRLAVVRVADDRGAVDPVAVVRVADDLVRVVEVGVVDRDDCVGRPDNSA
jgi:hypothetical protein